MRRIHCVTSRGQFLLYMMRYTWSYDSRGKSEYSNGMKPTRLTNDGTEVKMDRKDDMEPH